MEVDSLDLTLETWFYVSKHEWIGFWDMKNRVLGLEFHFPSFQKPGVFKYSSLERNYRRSNYYFLEEKNNNHFFSSDLPMSHWLKKQLTHVSTSLKKTPSQFYHYA